MCICCFFSFVIKLADEIIYFLQVWRNDVFMKTTQPHNGAIFAISMEGKWLFTGGWDKTVNVQVHGKIIVVHAWIIR